MATVITKITVGTYYTVTKISTNPDLAPVCGESPSRIREETRAPNGAIILYSVVVSRLRGDFAMKM